MLARNAEALYWIGRYVERADDTARILDVTVHQLLEDSSVDPDQTSRVLLQVQLVAIAPSLALVALSTLPQESPKEARLVDRLHLLLALLVRT